MYPEEFYFRLCAFDELHYITSEIIMKTLALYALFVFRSTPPIITPDPNQGRLCQKIHSNEPCAAIKPD
jgi:hypothetical protein